MRPFNTPSKQLSRSSQLTITILGIALSVFPIALQAQPANWIGTSSGWSSGSNWSTGLQPNNSTDVLFNDNGQSTINLANNARSARDVVYSRTNNALQINAGTGTGNSLTWNSLTANSGSTNLIIASQNLGTDARLDFTISQNLTLNSVLSLGNASDSSGDQRSSINSVVVGGTTTLNAGGQIALSRTTSSVNLSALEMNGGILNLTTGSGSNGSSASVENAITVTRLNGSSGFIQADKDNTQGHLIVNGATNGSYGGIIRNNATGAVIRLTKSGSSTLTLSGNNSHSGLTTVTGGVLVGDHNSAFGTGIVAVNGGIARIATSRAMSNAFVINGGELNVQGSATGSVSFGASGGLLSGNGSLGQSLALNNVNQVLAPGNSPGIMTFDANQNWASFTYEWELNSWSESAAAGTNFDQIAVNGSVDFSLASAGSIRLEILSLTAGNNPGLLPGFSEDNRQWTILTSSSIANFDASHWNIITSGFSSDPSASGSWSVTSDGNNIYLNYAIPEPSAGLLFGVAVSFCLIFRRRQLKNKLR